MGRATCSRLLHRHLCLDCLVDLVDLVGPSNLVLRENLEGRSHDCRLWRLTTAGACRHLEWALKCIDEYDQDIKVNVETIPETCKERWEESESVGRDLSMMRVDKSGLLPVVMKSTYV